MPKREVHLVRWQVVAAFIAVTIGFTFAIWKVQHDSASIVQLQRTNCRLKQFLVTAEQTRLQAAKRETGLRAQQDRDAARGYRDLSDSFNDGAIGRCRIPIIVIPPH